METDNLLPTIKEGDSENESVASTTQTHDTQITTHTQRRRSPYILGVALIFLMGMLTTSLIPSTRKDSSSVSNWDMLGRNQKATKQSKQLEECEHGDYAEKTLKRAYEIPLAALFRDSKGQFSFDASGVISLDVAYAVSRNSWSILKFGVEPYALENEIIESPKQSTEYSDYTALFQESGMVFAVRGSVQVKNESSHHAVIEELALNAEKTAFDVLESCPTKTKFSRYGDGIEGAAAIRDLNNTLVVLALCGENHCGQSQKQKPGNGVLVVLEKGNATDGSCVWSTKRLIHIPKSANFPDYSDIALDTTGRVAISSQEKSQVWVGQLKGHSAGLWDIEALEFDKDSATVYSFPKNDDCETIYCNIEGIHLVGTNTLVAVSGKVNDEQDFRCFDKDQSAHAFVIP